jgi:hypothetical protein
MKLKKKISNLKICKNKERQIKRTDITQVIFKINEKFYRMQINKNNETQSPIE